MIKKIFKFILATLAISSILFTIFFGYSMYEQYKESVRWDSSSLLSNIHNVPPALAKNYVTGDEEELTTTLLDVNNALNSIEKHKGIPKDELDSYTELHDRALVLIKKHKLEDDGISDPSDSLYLYIQTEKAIDKAYREVGTEPLSEYSKKLVDRLNKRDNTLDEIYLDRLSVVAKDYKSLEKFSKNALDKLGVFNGDTLYVGVKVDRTITQSILTDLSDKKLLRFANTRRLDTLLRDTSWDDILEHNESTKRYYSWQDSKSILESLVETSYRPVSSFETLEDVLNYNPYMTLKVPDGYKINRDSKVENIYYNGNLLGKDMYIKKGIHLTFDIDYTYTELEKEEEIIEIEWEDHGPVTPDKDPTDVPNNDTNNTTEIPNNESNNDSNNGSGDNNSNNDLEDDEIFQDGIGNIVDDKDKDKDKGKDKDKDKIEDIPQKP